MHVFLSAPSPVLDDPRGRYNQLVLALERFGSVSPVESLLSGSGSPGIVRQRTGSSPAVESAAGLADRYGSANRDAGARRVIPARRREADRVPSPMKPRRP